MFDQSCFSGPLKFNPFLGMPSGTTMPPGSGTQPATPRGSEGVTPTGTSGDAGGSSASSSDPFSSNWFKAFQGKDFDPGLAALLRGDVSIGPNSNGGSGGVSTVSTSSPTLSSFMNKPFVPYSESLSEHAKNGGAGTVFHNPIMHYDLASMGKYFTAVNKEAGIYEKNGMFYATKDLNGHPVLQPLGFFRGADGKWVAQGFSDKLSEAQSKELQDRILPAIEAKLTGIGIKNPTNEQLAEGLKKFTGMSPEDQEKFLKDHDSKKEKEEKAGGEGDGGDNKEGTGTQSGGGDSKEKPTH